MTCAHAVASALMLAALLAAPVVSQRAQPDEPMPALAVQNTELASRISGGYGI